MHRLLKRQWKHSFGGTTEIEALEEPLRSFVQFVNSAYEESDKERRLLEHTVELNSDELNEAYRTIKEHNVFLKDEVDEQTKLLQQYKEAIDQAFIVSKAGTDGKITYVNDLFCELSGYSREELLGNSHRIIRHPGQYAELFDTMWATITQKKLWRGEIKNRAKNGTTYHVEATIFPLLNASNEIIEYIAIRQDITEIQNSKHKLNQQLKYTKMIFDNQENIVLTANTDLGVTEANKNFFAFTNYHDLDEFRDKHQCVCELFVIKEGFLEPSIGDVHWTDPIMQHPYKKHRAIMKDYEGKEHIFSVALKSVNFDNEAFFIVSFTDITELVEAQELAEESGKAKSHFMANMSHELRTPLNGINGFTKLMLATELNDSQKKYIDFIEHSTESLLKIINSILDFSKIEEEHLELELLPINLHTYVENSLKVFLPETISKSISYIIDVDDQLSSCLKVDKFRLTQILTNLINNAIKFTPKEGTVKASAKLKERTLTHDIIHFSVCDTGIGIEEDKLEKVFNNFEQADTSTTRMYGGTGLGLSISSSLCRLMGGVLTVESTHGKGSCFFFDLKLERCDDIEAILVESKAEESMKNEVEVMDIEVLVVDDYEMNRILLDEMLMLHGVKVDFALNGAEAIKMIENKRYQMIFMDINMPVMNGVDATIEIRHLGKNVPIIACTSNAVAGDKEKYLACGMDDYISKPIDQLELNRVLKAFKTSNEDTSTGMIEENTSEDDNGKEKELTEVVDLIKNTQERLGFPMSTIIRLFQTFLKGSVESVKKLNDALRNNDIESIKSLAHAVKGTSHTFDMLNIVEMCQVLEGQTNPEKNEEYIAKVSAFITLLDENKDMIFARLEAL